MIKIITDSGADLEPNELEILDINVFHCQLPLTILLTKRTLTLPKKVSTNY